MPSCVLTKVSQVTLAADLLQHRIGGGRGQRLSGVEHPDAMLLGEGPGAADGAQRARRHSPSPMRLQPAGEVLREALLE